MSAPRHFYRCTDCLTVAAVDGPLVPGIPECAACGGFVEHLGRVQTDHLVTDHLKAACDDRCTAARGPKCSCKCDGENHGSGMRVEFTLHAGDIPTLETRPSLQTLAAVDRYRAMLEDVKNLVRPLAERKARGEFMPRHDFDRMLELQTALRAARKARTMPARFKTLGRILEPAHA